MTVFGSIIFTVLLLTEVSSNFSKFKCNWKNIRHFPSSQQSYPNAIHTNDFQRLLENSCLIIVYNFQGVNIAFQTTPIVLTRYTLVECDQKFPSEYLALLLSPTNSSKSFGPNESKELANPDLSTKSRWRCSVTINVYFPEVESYVKTWMVVNHAGHLWRYFPWRKLVGEPAVAKFEHDFDYNDSINPDKFPRNKVTMPSIAFYIFSSCSSKRLNEFLTNHKSKTELYSRGSIFLGSFVPYQSHFIITTKCSHSTINGFENYYRVLHSHSPRALKVVDVAQSEISFQKLNYTS